MSPLLAQSGHFENEFQCLLLGDRLEALQCPLLTQSGHEPTSFSATQNALIQQCGRVFEYSKHGLAVALRIISPKNHQKQSRTVERS
jgi:hypothetical protein